MHPEVARHRLVALPQPRVLVVRVVLLQARPRQGLPEQRPKAHVAQALPPPAVLPLEAARRRPQQLRP